MGSKVKVTETISGKGIRGGKGREERGWEGTGETGREGRRRERQGREEKGRGTCLHKFSLNLGLDEFEWAKKNWPTGVSYVTNTLIAIQSATLSVTQCGRQNDAARNSAVFFTQPWTAGCQPTDDSEIVGVTR